MTFLTSIPPQVLASAFSTQRNIYSEPNEHLNQLQFVMLNLKS